MAGILFKWRATVVCVCMFDRRRQNTKYGDRHSPWKWWTMKAKLTGTGDNRDVAQQAEDLWAEERTVPNVEKFVEKSLCTGKPLLVEKCDK